jgi:periplasmic copper chaperone A
VRIRDLRFNCVLLLSSVFAQSLWAAAPGIEISGAWARATPPTAQVGAVYFAMTNHGSKLDQLLAASTDVAAKVEIHDSRTVNGVMQMRQVTVVNCPAGATVKVEPGGLHVMLLGLKHPLSAGSFIDLTLRFRDAGSLAVHVPVQNER